jgi:hypothetical protein
VRPILDLLEPVRDLEVGLVGDVKGDLPGEEVGAVGHRRPVLGDDVQHHAEELHHRRRCVVERVKPRRDTAKRAEQAEVGILGLGLFPREIGEEHGIPVADGVDRRQASVSVGKERADTRLDAWVCEGGDTWQDDSQDDAKAPDILGLLDVVWVGCFPVEQLGSHVRASACCRPVSCGAVCAGQTEVTHLHNVVVHQQVLRLSHAQ